jgi:hypothetical protein
VNKPARYVKHGETADPSYQQNYEQDRPDAHLSLLHVPRFRSGPNDAITKRPVVCCIHNGNTVQDCSPQALAFRKRKTKAQPSDQRHDQQDRENAHGFP